MEESKSAFDGLTGLRVMKDCPANWNRMQGDDQVRYCTHCSKKVYNLSNMDRAAALDLMKQSEGKICVRYFVRPDGMVMTSDCPRGQVQKAKRLTAIAGIAAMIGVTLGCPATVQGVVISPESSIRHDLKMIELDNELLKESKDATERAGLLKDKSNLKARIREMAIKIASK